MPQQEKNSAESKKEKSKLPVFFRSQSVKRLFFLIVSTMILLGGGIFLLSQLQDRDSSESNELLFSVEGSDYYYSDIKNYLDGLIDRGIEQEEAIGAVRQAFVYRYISEEFDINYSDDDLRAILDENDFYEAVELESDEWAKLFAERNYIEDTVLQLLDGNWKQGYVFSYHFDSLIEMPDEYFDLEGVELPERMGDEQLIARDQEYSLSMATAHKEKLADGDIEPEAVIDEIMQDERLHLFYTIPASIEGSLSGPFGFDEDADWRDEVAVGEVIDFIAQYNETNQPSDIQTHSLSIEEEKIDIRYYFVYLTFSDTAASRLVEILERNEVAI